MARDRPLSFLDHHLRTGNSLVGVRIAALQPGGGKKKGKKARSDDASQLSMLEDDAFRRSVSNAVGSIWLIEESPADTLEDVREQERLYARLREDLTRRYARIADLVTGSHFGVEFDRSQWNELVNYASGRSIVVVPEMQRRLDTAAELANKMRFFHWELEFPDVFFDRQGRPLGDDAGFDAVVGNPPYVRQESLGDLKPYLRETFEAFHSVGDLYLYFYEQGIQLLRKSGRLGYISSGTFARANFAAGFRKLLPKVVQIESVVDFGENQPFEGAEMVRPSIVILRKDEQKTLFRSLLIADKVPESLGQALADEGIDSDPAALKQPESVFQSASMTWLSTKILEQGQPLLDVIDGRMYRGVLTGLNEAFIVDQKTRDRLIDDDPKSSEIIKPMLRGEDLRPWYREDEGRWLIFTRRGTHIEAYPAIRDYLSQFRERLEPRPADWSNARSWSGRKKGLYRWYEIQDSVDYYEAFDESKIFWPDIAKLPRFSWDDEGKYIGNTGYFTPSSNVSLLGILQSHVLWFAVSQILQPLRLRAGLWQYRMFSQFMSRLPIPYASRTEGETISALAIEITEEARARYELHRKTRHRIHSDLGTQDKKLNQKLTAWWNLDFSTFRAEVKKVFKQDIPLSERDEWEDWLIGQQGQHERRTAEIVHLETELNERVYELFDLTSEEIKIIEESTKYRYGEV